MPYGHDTRMPGVVLDSHLNVPGWCFDALGGSRDDLRWFLGALGPPHDDLPTSGDGRR
jgi:hypothetical protein